MKKCNLHLGKVLQVQKDFWEIYNLCLIEDFS